MEIQTHFTMEIDYREHIVNLCCIVEQTEAIELVSMINISPVVN